MFTSSFEKEKFGNIIIFFLLRTKDCGITKINKLLYFADFLSFRQIGKPLTGNTYEAWDFGPVPQPFYNDFRNIDPSDVPEYLSEFVTRDLKHITEEKDFNEFVVKKKFDSEYFSQQELDILKFVAKKFENTDPDEIVDLAHKTIPFKNAEKRGRNSQIDYLDSINNDNIIFNGKSLSKEELVECIKDLEFLNHVFS